MCEYAFHRFNQTTKINIEKKVDLMIIYTQIQNFQFVKGPLLLEYICKMLGIPN